MKRRSLTLTALLLIANGCAGIRFDGSFNPSGGDWTTYAGSELRSNFTATDLAPPFDEKWTYNAQGGILATPLVRDNVLIIATLHGELQLVSLSDGKRIGYVSLGAPIRGTPALYGLNVIVPLLSEEASLVYLGLREGRTFWKADAGPIESAPLLIGEQVLVSTIDGEMLSIDRSNGEERWRFAPGAKDSRKPFRSSPVRAGDLIACGNDDGSVYAVRLQDGELMWSSPTSAPVFATAVVVHDIMIVANIGGVVIALDTGSGKQMWRRELSSPVYASPSTDGMHVFVATAAGEVTAIDVRTGVPAWSWRGESVVNASPLVSDSYVYFGSLEKRFFVLDKATGEIVWSRELEGRMKVPPVIWDQNLIIVYEDRMVESLRPMTSP